MAKGAKVDPVGVVHPACVVCGLEAAVVPLRGVAVVQGRWVFAHLPCMRKWCDEVSPPDVPASEAGDAPAEV